MLFDIFGLMPASVLTPFDSYPFGSPIPGRSYANASSYRYGFNGKEKDNEVNMDGGDYDFGARIYDSRLGRWLSLDPLMKKFAGLSPYNYCKNSPIIYIDPNGLDPVIVITTEITGYSLQRIIGSDNGLINGVIGNSVCIVVPTYKAILYDRQADGTLVEVQTFNVTRDGWYCRGTVTNGNEKQLYLLNRAFEPTNGNSVEYSTQTQEDYPCDDLTAYRLVNKSNNTTTLPAEPLSETTDLDGTPIEGARKDNNSAIGVMFHIGGYYAYDMEWHGIDLFISDDTRLAGSEGCFGYIPNNDVYSTEQQGQAAFDIMNQYDDELSNDPYNTLIEKIKEMKKTSGKDLSIIVNKRDVIVKDKIVVVP